MEKKKKKRVVVKCEDTDCEDNLDGYCTREDEEIEIVCCEHPIDIS